MGLACSFGSFLPRERAARKGRNPQTQEPLDLPASVSPAFTASKVEMSLLVVTACTS